MLQIAREWAASLHPSTLILLEGTLGAGKTTFVKGLAQGLGSAALDAVQSPTFTYLHIHPLQRATLYHFDLYRLRGVDDFIELGFGEYLDGDGVCCIEWPERITPLLAGRPHWKIHLTHIDAEKRRLEIKFYG